MSAEQPHPHQAGRTGAAKPVLPQSRRPTDLCLVRRLHHWSVCFSHSLVQHQRRGPLWGLSHSPGGTDPISCPVGTVGYARVSLGSDGGPQAPAGWTEEREEGETELVERAGPRRGLHRLTDVLAHGASHVQGAWVRGPGTPGGLRPQLGGEWLLSTGSSLAKFSPGS